MKDESPGTKEPDRPNKGCGDGSMVGWSSTPATYMPCIYPVHLYVAGQLTVDCARAQLVMFAGRGN